MILKDINLITKQHIKESLERLGLRIGDTLIVHSSLSSIGWVLNGELDVIQALMEIITSEGTIVMPTQTTNLSDPKTWKNPSIPEDFHYIVKKEMMPYIKEISLPFRMGRIAEAFRTYPDVVRSEHPHVSVSAWGSLKEYVVSPHKIDYPFGENTPFSRLYDLNAKVLLIGVSYSKSTSFHLADNRCNKKIYIQDSAPILENGKKIWKLYNDIDTNEKLFDEIGIRFEREFPQNIRKGTIGNATTILFDLKASVDFAINYLNNFL